MLVDSFNEGAGDRSQSGEAEPQFDQQGHGIHWDSVGRFVKQAKSLCDTLDQQSVGRNFLLTRKSMKNNALLSTSSFFHEPLRGKSLLLSLPSLPPDPR